MEVKQRVHVRVSPLIKRKLDDEARSLGLNQGAVVERALEQYFRGNRMSEKDELLLVELKRISSRLKAQEQDMHVLGEFLDTFAAMLLSFFPKKSKEEVAEGRALAEARHETLWAKTKRKVKENISIFDTLGREFEAKRDDFLQRIMNS